MSNIPGIEDNYCVMILSLFRAVPPGNEVILFGSRAKGNFREGSDIDLALKGPYFTYEIKNEISLRYDDLFLPWQLDLVLYDAMSEPLLKEHIDRVGKKLPMPNRD